MKTHTAAARIIINCTTYRSLTSCAEPCSRLGATGTGRMRMQEHHTGWHGPLYADGVIARRPTPDYRPLQRWTRGSRPNGQRGPAGEGGSELRNVSEEAVIRVHPSSGMGTRSHSLTRHKAGCVCERGGGPREGF